MPGRIHQNDAPALSLASDVSSNSKTFPVNQSIENVKTPISYTISSGTSNEEIVTLVDKNTSASPSQFEGVVRGCDGTSAKPHASGEVLTHEATARDFVDADILDSETDPRTVTHYGHFPEDASSVDGYKIVSGHQLTVQQGTWEIKNGVLKNTSTPALITFPQTQKKGNFVSKISPSRYATGGPVLDYEDNQNFLWADFPKNTKLSVNLQEKYQGAISRIKKGNNTGGSMVNATIKATYIRSDKYGLRGQYKTSTGAGFSFGENSLTDKALQDQLNMGYYVTNDSIKISGFYFENINSV